MNHRIHKISEMPGAGRLGRHIEHDERSRCFALIMTSHAPLVSTHTVALSVPAYRSSGPRINSTGCVASLSASPATR